MKKIDTAPFFCDDDSSLSWLRKLGIDNVEELYFYYRSELDGELKELKHDGERKPLGIIYLVLSKLLSIEESQEKIGVLKRALSQIEERFVDMELKRFVRDLIAGDAVILADESDLI